MKKRILIILTLLLLTGCTGEYNLTINGNTYKEEVIITGENNEEISNFNQEWKVPIDKKIYDLAGDESTEASDITSETYNYNINSNSIKFNYDFSMNKLINSTAVSICYDRLNITNYNGTTIISTSSKNTCFDKYQTLNSLKINIKVDKPVVSNNADIVNGNIYTWNITKDSANRSINLVLDNKTKDDEEIIGDEIPKEEPKKKDYTLYIFCGILLVVMISVYFIFNKIKDKNNGI